MIVRVYQQSLWPSAPWSAVDGSWEQLPQLDFALLNECRGWSEDPSKVARAKRALNLAALPVASSTSGMASMILYNRDTIGEPVPHGDGAPLDLHEDSRNRTYHGWALAWFDLGLPEPVGVCSAKLTPYTPDGARAEAGYVATHPQRGGSYSLIGLDVNFSPAHSAGPAPNWATQQPYNIGSRALPGTARSGNPQPDRSIAQQITDKGYDDAAVAYADATGDRDALAHTSDYDRIDAVYTSRLLTPAITGYSRIPLRPYASDHDGSLVTLDTARVVAPGPRERVVWR